MSMNYVLSELENRFLNEARQKRRKIAVGIWRPEPEVVDSLWQAAGYADLTVVGCDLKGLNCMPTKDDDEASQVIVDLLKSGQVDGIVRAQLKDSYTHKIFLKTFGKPKPKFKSFISFFAKGDKWFAATTTSNYNSLNLEQKRYEITQAAKWMQDELGIVPKIGIGSTRRPTGKVGEFPLLEEIAERSATVANELRDKGYDVKEYYIEYERALWEDRNLICPSIGMVGNTWVKGLVYLGGWRWIGTPFLDQGAYYDDTARNNTNWFWPIVSTVAWINRHEK